jgi:hypothetical protein
MPVLLTRRYFDLLSKRDATGAYNLLSDGFHRHLHLGRYSKNVNNLPRAKIVDATLVSKTDRTATVAAVFEDATPESHQPQWRGSIELIREPGGWRIESMKGLIPASGHPFSGSANESDDETREP